MGKLTLNKGIRVNGEGEPLERADACGAARKQGGRRERQGRRGRAQRPGRAARRLDADSAFGPATTWKSCASARADDSESIHHVRSLVIAGRNFHSRLFLGTAGYPNRQVMLDAVAASGTEMATASIRRISLAGEEESLVDLFAERVHFLPNTAGCQTAKDAVLTAELAREALDTNWIKLEVIGDRELLYPNVEELLSAAEILVAEGLRRAALLQRRSGDLPEAGGCSARATVMPLGSPIGSGLGIANPHLIELICARSPVPVVLDAGIGTASDAALAMELGCAAVLLNTAVSKAQRSGAMAPPCARRWRADGWPGSAGRIPEARSRGAVEPAIRPGRHVRLPEPQLLAGHRSAPSADAAFRHSGRRLWCRLPVAQPARKGFAEDEQVALVRSLLPVTQTARRFVDGAWRAAPWRKKRCGWRAPVGWDAMQQRRGPCWGATS